MMGMADYRFHLQKYGPGSKTSCPSCGKKRCFTRYVDEDGLITFPANVGICDHINSCGYHYTPKQFFHDNQAAFPEKSDWRSEIPVHTRVQKKEGPTPSFIPYDIMKKTLGHYSLNPLFNYLKGIMDEESLMRLMEKYNVGTSKKWGGSTVFWQVDVQGRVRTGKIMCYDPETGHRVKEPHSRVCWVHTELKEKDYHLKQCLFGEHLLPSNPALPVIMVESEKTALIGSFYVPEILWLASGGINGCFNSETMKVLRGRDVTLMPDLGAMEIWRQKAEMLSSICRSITVSDVLEKEAEDWQREKGWDIADFLLAEPTKRQELQILCSRYPELPKLIEDLGLVLIE